MKRPSILLIGDLMIDQYLWGRCDRISPEAPVPVVEIESETRNLGGAGNVLNNLIALECDVHVVSVVGDDPAGKELTEMLEATGTSTDGLVIQPERHTSKKTRIIATHQQMLRYDRETRDPVDEIAANHLMNTIQQKLKETDIVLLSDYGKGVLSEDLCAGIIKEAKSAGKRVLVDPKGVDYSRYTGSYLITPNRKEAGLATGMELKNMEDVRKAGNLLRNQLKLDYAVITLSEEGMAVIGDELHHIPTRAREVFDVTGAGDTVLASLGYALVIGKDIDDAAKFANEAAAVVVAKVGAATVTLEEIEKHRNR